MHVVGENYKKITFFPAYPSLSTIQLKVLKGCEGEGPGELDSMLPRPKFMHVGILSSPKFFINVSHSARFFLVPGFLNDCSPAVPIPFYAYHYWSNL